jgi:hypothetical protein
LTLFERRACHGAAHLAIGVTLVNKLGDVTLPAEFDPMKFARMIAKIAHANAVAQRGLNGFQPLALEAILDEEPADIW